MIHLKAFFILYIFCFTPLEVDAQNVIDKKIVANDIETISIEGHQIFNISIKTAQTDYISITSKLDGEYQNDYQIVIKHKDNQLVLGLEFMSFEAIPDDKRNAHKVIAAALFIEIPEDINLSVFSDIGSVIATGNFKTLAVELLQGHCEVNAISKNVVINTIDGNINVVTDNVNIIASSKNGNVITDDFSSLQGQWTLRSINGNITAVKQE